MERLRHTAWRIIYRGAERGDDPANAFNTQP